MAVNFGRLQSHCNTTILCKQTPAVEVKFTYALFNGLS
jgi:hypothetical protein